MQGLLENKLNSVGGWGAELACDKLGQYLADLFVLLLVFDSSLQLFARIFASARSLCCH